MESLFGSDRPSLDAVLADTEVEVGSRHVVMAVAEVD